MRVRVCLVCCIGSVNAGDVTYLAPYMLATRRWSRDTEVPSLVAPGMLLSRDIVVDSSLTTIAIMVQVRDRKRALLHTG